MKKSFYNIDYSCNDCEHYVIHMKDTPNLKTCDAISGLSQTFKVGKNEVHIECPKKFAYQMVKKVTKTCPI